MLIMARPSPEQTLDAAQTAGGFVWWYLDLRGTGGEGLVIIWSLGLPFLPGARRSEPALSRPAVSIAHYSGGKQQLYLLQDYERDDAELDLGSGSGRIGQSSYQVRVEQEKVRLEIRLDEPLPSSKDRFRGHITLEGPATGVARSEAATSTSQHLWAPQSLCAHAKAVLHYGDRKYAIEGSGYFDSNVSNTPLHDQGISSWRWGRISFERASFVYYEIEAPDGCQRYLFEQGTDRPMNRMPGRLTFSSFRRGTYGLRIPDETFIAGPETSIWAHNESVVEDGPFYSRSLLAAVDERGQPGYGYAEVVVPERIDRPWQRPLVRMRTHQIGRSNSPFLPLFSGPREGRASRVLSSLWERGISV